MINDDNYKIGYDLKKGIIYIYKNKGKLGDMVALGVVDSY